MGFFRKSKDSTNDVPAGRRRPLQGAYPSEAPNKMFSYYSQRNNASTNLGRRESPETIDAGHGTGVFSVPGRHKVLTLIILFVGMGCLVLASISSTNPRIVLLQDDTTAYFLQEREVYQRTAEQSLQKSVFNRNKLTVDTANVRLELLKHHPEIKNVSVALPLFGTQPQVYIEPYKPSFILTTTSSNAFLLDATGRALANTNQIMDVDNLGVPTIQDKTGSSVELGSRALPSTTVTFAQTVLKALNAKGIKASTLTLPAAAYQLDVAIAGQPYYVKFNLENDALQQAGTYLAVQNRLKVEKKTPAQYVDVRVPDRAYYK